MRTRDKGLRVNELGSFGPVHNLAQPLSGTEDMLPHRLTGRLLVMRLDGRRNREMLIEGRGLGPLQLERLRVPHANKALDRSGEAQVERVARRRRNGLVK